MQQYTAWWIDTQPCKQFGIAQRQLHHFAQLADGIAHAADIIIGHIGAADIACLGIFGPQLNLSILIDMDKALWRRCHHGQPDFGQ